jgi:predicted anti-sigma-YlaC factor YlaD
MRVRHLTDIELQGLLDRRDIAVPSQVPGALYLKDMDSQEHVDNCPDCRAELELYRQLYCELGQPVEVKLPKNFATRVTFSLPPFKAQRTRARLQMAAIWGTSLLISLFWIIAQLDFVSLAARSLVTGYEWYRELTVALFALGGLLPRFEIGVLQYFTPLLGVWDSVVGAFSTNASKVNLTIVAGAILLIVAWIDRLFLSSLRQER